MFLKELNNSRKTVVNLDELIVSEILNVLALHATISIQIREFI